MIQFRRLTSEGPLRMVIPDEKRQARWVRQVINLTILEAPEGKESQ